MAKKGYSHLTKNERAQIEVLLKEGYSARNIGGILNRSGSTISR